MPVVKQRFYLFVILGVIVLGIIIAVAASASQPKPPVATPTSTPDPSEVPPTIISVTINSEVGVKQVTVTNLNTGTSIIKRSTDLPFTFKASSGDSLRFNVQTETSYQWNAWVFQTGTFDNHNPLTIKVYGDIEMSPQCLVQEAPVE